MTATILGQGGSHPRPHTEAYAHLLRDLRQELARLPPAKDPEDMKRAYGKRILAFMIARDCWPMGTQVEVRDDFTVTTRFPHGDEARR